MHKTENVKAAPFRATVIWLPLEWLLFPIAALKLGQQRLELGEIDRTTG